VSFVYPSLFFSGTHIFFMRIRQLCEFGRETGKTSGECDTPLVVSQANNLKIFLRCFDGSLLKSVSGWIIGLSSKRVKFL
jgi:hypothetical protein